MFVHTLFMALMVGSAVTQSNSPVPGQVESQSPPPIPGLSVAQAVSPSQSQNGPQSQPDTGISPASPPIDPPSTKSAASNPSASSSPSGRFQDNTLPPGGSNDGTNPQPDVSCAASDWSLTPANWQQSGTESFLARQLKLVRDGQKANPDLSFVNDVLHRYVPTDRAFDCAPDHLCKVENCQFFDMTKPDAKQAYFTLASIAHLNDYHGMLSRAVDLAQGNITTYKDSYLQSFSAAAAKVYVPAEWEHIGISLIGLVLLMAFFAANTFTGSVLGLLAPLILGVLNEMATKDHTPIVDVAALTGRITAAVHQTLSTTSERLLAGRDTRDTGVGLEDLLQKGRFMKTPVHLDVQMSNIFNHAYSSIAINSIWLAQHTYISATPTSDCEADKRGPQETKYCAKGDPNTVYYGYVLPEIGNMPVKFPAVRRPIGWDKLDQFGRVKFKEVMASSIASYYANILDPFSSDGVNRPALFAGVEDADSPAIALGAAYYKTDAPAYPSHFTIPVCFDSTESQIVDIYHLSDDDNPYGVWGQFNKMTPRIPCHCGPRGQDTASFRVATGLDKVGFYVAHCDPSNGPGGNTPDKGRMVPEAWKPVMKWGMTKAPSRLSATSPRENAATSAQDQSQEQNQPRPAPGQRPPTVPKLNQ